MSRIFLVRHAPPGGPFVEIAQETGTFLSSLLSGEKVKILSSPTDRTVETAQIVAEIIGGGVIVEVEETISEDYSEFNMEKIRALCEGHHVILVTHLPCIGDILNISIKIPCGSVWEEGKPEPIFVPSQS